LDASAKLYPQVACFLRLRYQNSTSMAAQAINHGSSSERPLPWQHAIKTAHAPEIGYFVPFETDSRAPFLDHLALTTLPTLTASPRPISHFTQAGENIRFPNAHIPFLLNVSGDLASAARQMAALLV